VRTATASYKGNRFPVEAINRRSRRTSSSTGRHQIASHSRLSSCGPFTTSVSNLSTSAGGSSSLLQRLTWPTSVPLARPGQYPVSGQLYEPTAEGDGARGSVSCY
jgi:hypothetical protein